MHGRFMRLEYVKILAGLLFMTVAAVIYPLENQAIYAGI